MSYLFGREKFRIERKAVHEISKNVPEIFFVLFDHLSRIIQRVVSVAQDVHEPGVEDTLRIAGISLDAVTESLETVKARGFLQHAAQHVEVVGVEISVRSRLVQFLQECDVVEEWRIFFLLFQAIFGGLLRRRQEVAFCIS